MLGSIKCELKTKDREANSIAIFKGYSKEIYFIKELVNKVIQQTYYWALDEWKKNLMYCLDQYKYLFC